MIILTTNCKDCIHNEICKYKDNAANAMDRLKSKVFDNSYTWEDSMNNQKVDITFSCSLYSPKVSLINCR